MTFVPEFMQFYVCVSQSFSLLCTKNGVSYLNLTTMTTVLALNLYITIKDNPLSIIFIISYLISISSSQTVAPQNETATSDIYYASLDPHTGTPGFQLGVINCAANKDCYIFCDIDQGCSQIYIHAENAKSLYIECNAVSSCSHLFRVYGPTTPTTSVATVVCTANTACTGPNSFLNFDDTAIVNIICTGSIATTVGSCTELKIYTSSNIKNVNISCGPYDCNNLELSTKPSSLNTFLTCDGPDSCTDASITCINNNGQSTLSWDLPKQEWICSDESCCPLINSDGPIITNMTVTVIDCTSTENCQNRYIDGSAATLLTVNCDSENSCKYTKIICPSLACTITCKGDYSCQDITIDASESNKLDLDCDATSACQRADVYCPTDTDSCFVNCGGKSSSCQDMQIFQILDTKNLYFDIKCPPTQFTNACNNIRFQCPLGIDETILDWTDTLDTTSTQSDPGECTGSTSVCCPFGTLSPTTEPPTRSPPTLPPYITSRTTKASAPTMHPSQAPTTNQAASNEGESGELIYIIIGGFGVLALCVCFWGGFIWWQKKRNSGYGEGERGSKSSRHSNQTGHGGNNNTNMNGMGSGTNPGVGHSPLMGNNLSDKFKTNHLEIEKSIEMQSTTQGSITEPTATHNTITAYNPSRKTGAGATITITRNISNAPPPPPTSLGLADLGTASGWE